MKKSVKKSRATSSRSNRGTNGTTSPPVETTDSLFQVNESGRGAALVLRRPGLANIKPRLDAPPPTQPGSADFFIAQVFGSRDRGLEFVESLIAGQAENADPKWVNVILLYREWEARHKLGRMKDPPTLNLVCHSLNFDTPTFIRELQTGMLAYVKSQAVLTAVAASPEVIKNLNSKAKDKKADTKTIELQLRVAGVIDERGAPVQVNVNQQQAVVMNKGDKDKQRAPLLQFIETVEIIDAEVRRTDDISGTSEESGTIRDE
jgi:hypothetical protein